MAGFGDKVVYQVYPRSFQDSDGDGMGDLPGITRRLGYLAELGVDYLWITPFFLSPQRDNGYDVADYRSVDPRFGTMADLDELVAEAAGHGIGIMLDMVFNHTSTEHEWFRRALAGERRYQDYYIWRDGKVMPDGSVDPTLPPTNWVSKFGGSAWEFVPEVGRWYLHLFDVSQADLNWENPEVIDELADVVRFWLGKGVSGFRFDVVNLISKPDELLDDFEGDGRRFYTDGPRVHEHLQELVRRAGLAGRITVGEMSSTSIDNCIRYSHPEAHELTMTFSFHHLKVDYKDGQKWVLKEPDFDELRELFARWNEDMEAGGGWNAWFWTNHDQPRAVGRFADAGRFWSQSAKMLGTCTHLMRGTPYVYQGEELGMVNPGYTTIDDYQDVESKNYYRILLGEGKSEEEALHIVAERSRDDGRTPMQWDPSDTAGFTTGVPWLKIPENRSFINAEAEVGVDGSVFSYYQRLIALRHELPVIQEGSITFPDLEGAGRASKVIAYRRDLGDERLLVICSFGSEASEVRLPAEFAQAETLIDSYEDGAALVGGVLSLRPYEGVALRA